MKKKLIVGISAGVLTAIVVSVKREMDKVDAATDWKLETHRLNEQFEEEEYE